MPVQDQMSGGDHVHMLAAAAAMSMPGLIDGVQGSGAAGDPQLVQVVAAAPMQAHYIQQGVGIEEEQGGVGDGGGGAGDGGASGGMVVEVAAEQEQQVGVATRSQTANQLTLSFQGEVYVFESVSPEKVSRSIGPFLLCWSWNCVVSFLFGAFVFIIPIVVICTCGCFAMSIWRKLGTDIKSRTVGKCSVSTMRFWVRAMLERER